MVGTNPRGTRRVFFTAACNPLTEVAIFMLHNYSANLNEINIFKPWSEGIKKEMKRKFRWQGIDYIIIFYYYLCILFGVGISRKVNGKQKNIIHISGDHSVFR